MSHRFDELCRVVVEAQNRGRGHSATRSQRRARFVDAVVNPGASDRAPMRWVWWMTAMAGVAATLLLLLVFFPSDDDEDVLQFTVASATGEASHPPPGDWISAGDQPVDVSFSDGTELRVLTEAKARIEPSRTGARIVVESGAVRLHVAPHADARWRVDAGPFTVRVTGTVFAVDWTPELGELVVNVEKGSVAVEGPAWSTTQVVTAGQSLEAQAPQGKIVRIDPPASAPDDETGVADAPIERSSPTAGTTKRGRDRGNVSRTHDWKALAARGEHRAAVAAAEATGFGRLSTRLSARDLLTLGESARYARSVPKATEAFSAVRRRFPGTPAAATAAYNLGLIAFDQRHKYSAAAKWFRTYLDEQPRGALAREAMGRLMESHDRAGDHTKARAVALEYVARFPRGAHADLATRLSAGAD